MTEIDLTPDELVYDVNEAARVLHTGRTTIYRLIETGDLTRIKIGRRALVTGASVRAYVERLTAEATR